MEAQLLLLLAFDSGLACSRNPSLECALNVCGMLKMAGSHVYAVHSGQGVRGNVTCLPDICVLMCT